MALSRVDPGLVIWLWITFGIILLILRFTAWDRITGALDKRSQKIASDLESARLAGEKATAVLAEYDAEHPRGEDRGRADHRGRAHGGRPAPGRDAGEVMGRGARAEGKGRPGDREGPRDRGAAGSAARSSRCPSPSRRPSSSGRRGRRTTAPLSRSSQTG